MRGPPRGPAKLGALRCGAEKRGPDGAARGAEKLGRDGPEKLGRDGAEKLGREGAEMLGRGAEICGAARGAAAGAEMRGAAAGADGRPPPPPKPPLPLSCAKLASANNGDKPMSSDAAAIRIDMTNALDMHSQRTGTREHRIRSVS
jgi:hypothetical protein